jgi:hypothetical protein
MLSPQQAASQPALSAPVGRAALALPLQGGFSVRRMPARWLRACLAGSAGAGRAARTGDGVGGDEEQIVPMHTAERHRHNRHLPAEQAFMCRPAGAKRPVLPLTELSCQVARSSCRGRTG